MPHVLITDDDLELCDLLSQYLKNEAIEVTAIHDGLEAINHLQELGDPSQHYDALVLDFMLPGMQGLDILQRLRQFSSIPVLMLTARGDDIDRIVGLESGADDYLPKPCNPRELLARLRAVLRRSEQRVTDVTKTTYQAHGITLDTGKRLASVNQNTLDLTSAEFNTLLTLISKQGEIVSKEDLTQMALNRKFSRYDRSIDVHISSVRKKLSQQLSNQNIIKTVRGSGYILVNENDA